MNLFEYSDYRSALKDLLKEKGLRGERVTLRKLADRLQIQHTYLSKVLKPGSGVHLGEDALSELCAHLGLLQEEEEFIFFLRSYEVSHSTQRRKRLLEKIEVARNARKLNVPRAESDRLGLERESSYLLNPIAVLAHVALHAPKFRDSPLDLCKVLGIEAFQLRQLLNQLVDAGLIDLSSDRKKVTAVRRSKMHLGIEHPLMRSHQLNLRSFGASRLMQLEDSKRKSFTVAFTADSCGYAEALKHFDVFIKQIRDITARSKQETLYQLNFDLFAWE